MDFVRNIVVDQRLLEKQLPRPKTVLQSEIEPDCQRAGELGVGRDELRRVALRELGIVAEVGGPLGARAQRGAVRTDDAECVGVIERDLECAKGMKGNGFRFAGGAILGIREGCYLRALPTRVLSAWQQAQCRVS